MPNHIANLVVVKGDTAKVKQFFDKVLVEKIAEDNSTYTAFDFNAILPMPEDLDIPASSTIEQYAKTGVLDLEAINKMFHTEEEVKAYVRACYKGAENLKKYGYIHWYDWSRHNWGTKWNSYDLEILSDDSVMFNTAWSTPTGIWHEIAKQFPDLEITVTYADEDCGYNCGIITIKDGEVSEYAPIGGSDEAMELYFQTHPDMEDEFIYKEGKGWVYKDDEDEEEYEEETEEVNEPVSDNKVWIRLGGYVQADKETVQKIKDGDTEALIAILKQDGFEVNGQAYVPETEAEFDLNPMKLTFFR